MDSGGISSPSIAATPVPIVERFLGITWRTGLIFLALVLVFFYTQRKTEGFTPVSFTQMAYGHDISGLSAGTNASFEEQYVQDVQNLAYTVGPYIGDMYTYLRSKYLDQLNVPAPDFLPGDSKDPTFSDGLLPIAREQIRNWIDSNKFMMEKKYGIDKLSEYANVCSLTYKDGANGVLEVTYVNKGSSKSYFL